MNKSTRSTSTLLSDATLKFAIFNGTEEITDEMYQEVLAFIEHIHTNAPKKEKTAPVSAH